MHASPWKWYGAVGGWTASSDQGAKGQVRQLLHPPERDCEPSSGFTQQNSLYLCPSWLPMLPTRSPSTYSEGKKTKQNKTGKRPKINETKLRCVSIPEEINPEYSLEGLMLKLKLQYFSHLMQRADSLEKTWMLRKIEG